MKKGSTGNRYTKRKLTKYHKQMLKADAMDNHDIYAGSTAEMGGFDGSTTVDADIYTEINKDFGNTKWKENVGDDGLANWDDPSEDMVIQERVDDLIGAYIDTLKLDPNKKGSFTRESEEWTAKHMQTCNLGHEHFVS